MLSPSGSLLQFEKNMLFQFFFLPEKNASALQYKFAMANYMTDFGNEETAREAAELCGGTELIGQISWHLKQVAKHFY